MEQNSGIVQILEIFTFKTWGGFLVWVVFLIFARITFVGGEGGRTRRYVEGRGNWVGERTGGTEGGMGEG